MASTEAIAAAFRIDPQILQKWLEGNQPVLAKYAFTHQQIFSQFEYVGGEWHPKSGREPSVAALDEPSQTQNAIESEREHYPNSSEGDLEPHSTAIFQAVGIVTGAVHLDLETHKNTVTIGSSTYPLFTYPKTESF
ncbi:MAG: hypothetical protein N4J56_007053 [Chroococcidiopsis sp. SAG 2025]|nr:hypothetical protein [Chroococcidiopsis sp. SAG 2025]MDV2997348.1 hypothetical protein [Chroococcidiopsis sp. SAG 2025]